MAHTVVEKTLTIPAASLPAACFSAGTWTLTDTSGVLTQVKTTAASTSVIRIPIPIERVESGSGVKITKTETDYKVGTADLDADFTIVLGRNTVAAPTAHLAITQTDDFAQTATAGLVVGTVTPTYPAFDRVEANNSASNKVTDPCSYYLEITVATDADNSFALGDTTVYYQIED